MLRSILIAAILFGAGAAAADDPAAADPAPAAVADGARSRAERSFDTFAREWMAKARGLEEHYRANPDVKLGSTAPVITYRGYGDEYTLELRPTGYPSAPYVGLLSYVEHVYSCTRMDAQDCQVAASTPVTEIFRYQDGRWTY
jgi:hypothetical protein